MILYSYFLFGRYYNNFKTSKAVLTLDIFFYTHNNDSVIFDTRFVTVLLLLILGRHVISFKRDTNDVSNILGFIFTTVTRASFEILLCDCAKRLRTRDWSF